MEANEDPEIEDLNISANESLNASQIEDEVDAMDLSSPAAAPVTAEEPPEDG